MLTCLQTPEFFMFLEYVKDIIIAMVGDTVVLETTGNGKVIWNYNYSKEVWCVTSDVG